MFSSFEILLLRKSTELSIEPIAWLPDDQAFPESHRGGANPRQLSISLSLRMFEFN